MIDPLIDLGRGERRANMPALVETLARRVVELEEALSDSLSRISGWIETKCPDRYKAEHLADLDKKRAILANASAK